MEEVTKNQYTIFSDVDARQNGYKDPLLQFLSY